MNIQGLTRRFPFPGVKHIGNALFTGAVFAAVIAGLVALRVGWLEVLLPHGEPPAEVESAAVEEVPTLVELPPAKLASAGIHTSAAATKPLRELRTVPGRIQFDQSRRLTVNVPVASAVVKVLVEPGEQIKAGAPLAVLTSSEVGQARDERLKRQADLAIAQREQRYDDETAATVAELCQLLAKRPKMDEVEGFAAGKRLGDYRETIVGAYSKLILTEKTTDDTQSLAGTGALSKRVADQRRSDLEVAKAAFQSACETSRITSVRERDQSRSAAEQAERLLKISEERIAALLGPHGADSAEDGDSLSQFTVTAPFAGQIEERHVVQAERLDAGRPLFTLADTHTLWVAAEIHERDWPALQFARDAVIEVRIPALRESTRSGRLRFVGSQVSAESHSVPLVVEVDNADGLLKPGMFAWVDVPLADEHTGLAVPAGAIMRHEGRSFVFVPEGEGKFRRVDVTTGLETKDEIEITSGLKEGQTVVDAGTFYLKSELLLEHEEE